MTSERRLLVSSILASTSVALKNERTSDGEVIGEEGAVLESPPVTRGWVNCLNKCKFSLESGGLKVTVSESCLEVSVDKDFTRDFIMCLCLEGGVESFGSTSVERDFTKLIEGLALAMGDADALEDNPTDLDGEETVEEELVTCSVGEEMADELGKGDACDRTNGTALNTLANEEGSNGLTVFSGDGIDVESATAVPGEVA